MASFADYAAKEDDLTTEIEDAQAAQQSRDEKGRFIPERFKDKGISDVIQSYEELEKLNSRQAQDLGQMRQQVDQLIKSQSVGPAEEPAKPLSVDDLYENPDEAIRRVAHEAVSKEITELRSTVEQFQQDKVMQDLDGKFPGWLEVSQSPEFAQWVSESPYRGAIATAVQENGDLAAAQELLGLYYDHNPPKDAAKDTEMQAKLQDQQLRDATLESSGPATANTTSDTYSRNDLLEARLSAKKGDMKAQRWLAANSEAIAAAYAEGRIVD